MKYAPCTCLCNSTSSESFRFWTPHPFTQPGLLCTGFSQLAQDFLRGGAFIAVQSLLG